MAKKSKKKLPKAPTGPKPSDVTPKTIAVGKMLERKRAELGIKSQDEFARKYFGLTQGGYNKWVVKGLRVGPRSRAKVAELLQRSQHELFAEETTEFDRRVGAGKMSRFTSESLARTVPVIGEAIQGAWRDETDAPSIIEISLQNRHLEWSDVATSQSTVPAVPDGRYTDLQQFALRVPGTSMNARIPEGGWVICVRYDEVRSALTDGDMVLAERHRPGQVETTVKRLRRVRGTWELRPESHDPKWQDPIRLEPSENGALTEAGASIDTKIKIAGLVVGIWGTPWLNT